LELALIDGIFTKKGCWFQIFFSTVKCPTQKKEKGKKKVLKTTPHFGSKWSSGLGRGAAQYTVCDFFSH
jgi:hypothetical protein